MHGQQNVKIFDECFFLLHINRNRGRIYRIRTWKNLFMVLCKLDFIMDQ